MPPYGVRAGYAGARGVVFTFFYHMRPDLQFWPLMATSVPYDVAHDVAYDARDVEYYAEENYLLSIVP